MKRLLVLCLMMSSTTLCAAGEGFNYHVGTGKADITGPAVGVQMFGFARADQITEGLHTRLYARAYIIVDERTGKRIALVIADLGSITNFMQLDVIERLHRRIPDKYTLNNVILSATHTHAGPGGYWHYGLGSAFHEEHYDALINGMVDALTQAHESLKPGTIYINRGRLENAGVNRSMVAYLNNPEEERARYDAPTDKEMTLIKLVTEEGPVGVINWFAVHPTAMNYFNRLISGDLKGAASQLFEGTSDQVIAAFAQTNCGDVTTNTNLNNTGPGETDVETTRIFAENQNNKARELFDSATERLNPGLASIHTYIDMSGYRVDDAFTNAGPQRTCPSAYGYAFAAGSTEDGGGHPLFKEGMTTPNPMIDNMVKEQLKVHEPSDECRECHAEKAILIATGEMKPKPSSPQVLPVTLSRIGQLVLISIPAEVTTMAGRRMRDTVAEQLGPDNYYVIVAYANEYAGYITTREEYATQQYEGGHTLYGPWTLAAYQQELTRLAKVLNGESSSYSTGPTPEDIRDEVKSTALGSGPDVPPEECAYGAIQRNVRSAYKSGESVEVVVWSGDPSNAFSSTKQYFTVQRLVNSETFETTATDGDWSTTCRWARTDEGEGPMQMTASWNIPANTAAGEYRIVVWGISTDASDISSAFEVVSDTFKVN